MTLEQKLQQLTAVAFDVDGVLTDGRVTWAGPYLDGTDGPESRTFHYADIMGISLLRRLGLRLALISGEPSPLVDRYAAKLHLHFVRKGTRDKATALREFSNDFRLDLARTAFFGDDINDLFPMQIAGLSCCPADAATHVRDHITGTHGFLATRPGGSGAVREFADAILASRGLDPCEVFLRRPPE